jgi:transposase
MTRFLEGMDRGQATLLPECLEDWVDENNPVRAVDVFVEALDLVELGFDRAQPMATGRPGYKPAVLLKLYIYGYLNRVQSSRRLEREAGRNLEVMWLTGRLAPDHKTIADFRKDNGPAIKKVCAQFVELCRKMGLLAKASVAIDGSKFKAVNSRDNNFTKGKLERRLKQIEESVARYMGQLDTAGPLILRLFTRPGPVADERNVRMLQCTCTVSGLLDHFVREREDLRRNLHPQRLGGFRIHDHFEFHRQLNRQVGRPCSAENAIHIGGGAIT